MRKNHSFHSIVSKNEFKAIRGFRYQTILYLSSILFFTFLCIGFANNALQFQKKLAKNPLSNWINLDIDRSLQPSLNKLMSALSDTALRDKYYLQNVYYSKQFGATFLDRKGIPSRFPLPKVNTVSPGSSIINDLFNESNQIKAPVSKNVFMDEPFGVIVTVIFLKDLGFHSDSVKYLSYRLYGNKYVQVPVLGVVKELPFRAALFCTDDFYTLQQKVFPDDSLYTGMFLETTDPQKIARVKEAIRKEFGFPPTCQIADSVKGVNKAICILYFSNSEKATREVFYDNCKRVYRLSEFKNLNFGAYYKVSRAVEQHIPGETCTRDNAIFNFDFLSIEFYKLDRIKEFSEYLKEEYNLSMNMETVYQRQNFLFSLNVSFAAIFLILGLSGFAVVIFLSNTLKNHLDRIKRNLGNFMAFGGFGRQIIGIYIFVVMKILFISLLISLSLAGITGVMLDTFFIKKVLILEENQSFFSLINPYMAGFIVIVILVALSKTYYNVWLLVRQSPGNLLHEREKKLYK